MRNTTRWSRVKQEYLLTAVMGGANNITAPDINDVNTWSWSRLVNTKDVSNRILTNQTNITSTFDTGSIGHDVSAGVEFTRENQTNYGVNARTAPAVNLYHPVSNLSIGGLDRNGANANGQTDTFGIYAFDTLTLTERIEINGGLRLDNYHTKYDSATACGGSGRGAIACPPGQSTGSPVTTVDTAKSGNLVNWEKPGRCTALTEQGNVYVNYAISQQPPGGSSFALAASGSGNSANRTDFKPQKAKSSELGTKWQIFDNRLLLSAALFRTDIENCINDNPYLEGYIFEVSGEIQGYGMIAKSFSTEFGRPCMWIEDIYIKESCRGAGIGSKFIDYIGEKYPDAILRLEVEEENERAVNVYKKNGFSFLPYLEMKK